MADKKTTSKPTSRGRLSLASSVLGSVGQGNLPLTLPEQPWRDKKPKGKKRNKK